MANFSTKFDTTAPAGTPRKDISNANSERYLVFQDKEGRKNLVNSDHNVDLVFDQIFLTGQSGKIELSSTGDLNILSGADITVSSGLNNDILFKQTTVQKAGFLNDAYQDLDQNGQPDPGSGHFVFVFGATQADTVDNHASYLDNGQNKKIHFSIGTPGTAQNLYVSGDLEVDGHFQADSTVEFDGVVTFDDTPIFNNGAIFQTAGTLDIQAPVATSIAGAFEITSGTTSTSTSTGAAIITGGVGISENLNVGGDVSIAGNLQVLGTTTSIETATLQVEDNIIVIGKTSAAPTADTLYDLGIRAEYYKGSLKNFFFGLDASQEKFVFYSDMGNPAEDDADLGTAGFQQSVVGANAVLGDVKFGKIYTNQLSSASFPVYGTNGIADAQVNAGLNQQGQQQFANILQANTAGGQANSFIIVNGGVNATSKTTGALQIAHGGGLGVDGDIYASNIFADTAMAISSLTQGRVLFTGAGGAISVDDKFQIDPTGAGSISIFDNAGTPVKYAEFDGTNLKFIAADIQLQSAVVPGGLIFSDNQGNLEDDQRISFNSAANNGEFVVQATPSGGNPGAMILRVEEDDGSGSPMVTAIAATVQSLNTNGGITFSDATGLLQDHADLVWTGSEVDITGGIHLTGDIFFDGAGLQKLHMDRNSADDLHIERQSDTAGAQIKLIAEHKTDLLASVAPSIVLHARKPAGFNNATTDNVGEISLRSDKSGVNQTAVSLLAINGAVEVQSGQGILLDDLVAKSDSASNSYNSAANIHADLSLGALGSDVKIATLIDAYENSVGDSPFLSAAKPILELEYGLGLRADAPVTFNTTTAKSAGILHTTMSTVGGGAVEQPELRYNGELIVGWNGTNYSVAGASLQAVYDESLAIAAAPMVLVGGNNGDDLTIQVNANAGFEVGVGGNAADLMLSAKGTEISLGSSANTIALTGKISTSVELVDDATAKFIGYSANPGNQNPPAGPLTIRGQSTSTNIGGDIYFKAGAGNSAVQKAQSGVVFDQTDDAYIGWKQNFTEKQGVKIGYVLDATFSPCDVSATGQGVSKFKGVVGIAQYASSNLGNAKIGAVAMCGSVCYVAEQGTSLSNFQGLGNPAPAGTRVFVHPDGPGTVTPNAPVAHGQRVVQVGYVVDATAPLTLNNETLIKIVLMPQDEGVLYTQ